MNTARADATVATSAAVGWYSSQSPPAPDDGLDVDTIATDIGEHIANDAERRDHRDPVRGSRRARQQQGGERDNATKHQASLPIIGASRRQVPVATSEIPNSNPAASTIAGPEGRLP